MPQVFISYSRKDKKFARKLTDALAMRKLDSWVDWQDIPPSADWVEEVYRGAETSDAVPQNSEERQEIFALKKQVVNTLVRRVTIDRNRELHVEISLNLLNLINYDTPQRFEGQNKDQIKPAGVYPDRRDPP